MLFVIRPVDLLTVPVYSSRKKPNYVCDVLDVNGCACPIRSYNCHHMLYENNKNLMMLEDKFLHYQLKPHNFIPFTSIGHHHVDLHSIEFLIRKIMRYNVHLLIYRWGLKVVFLENC